MVHGLTLAQSLVVHVHAWTCAHAIAKQPQRMHVPNAPRLLDNLVHTSACIGMPACLQSSSREAQRFDLPEGLSVYLVEHEVQAQHAINRLRESMQVSFRRH